MSFIFNDFENFAWYSVVIRLALAMLLGGMVGLERARLGRSAGMRTHILVCIGAALCTLLSAYCISIGYATDPLRLGAQVISGIGFLGTGIILVQNKSRIVGLTTAAGLWNTAIIGLACGIGFYEGAILCFAIAIVTSLLFPKIEKLLSQNDRYHVIYIELVDSAMVNSFYDTARALNCGEVHKIDVTSPKSTNSGRIGINLAISIGKGCSLSEVKNTLRKIDGVEFAIEV